MSGNVDERNVLALLRLVEDGFNSDNLDLLDDVIAPDVMLHVPFPIPDGRDAFKAQLALLRHAFADIVVTIDDVALGGDSIYRRWSASGTHTGELSGIAPTGRAVRISGVDIERFEDGRVVEHWSFWDPHTLISQLTDVPR